VAFAKVVVAVSHIAGTPYFFLVTKRKLVDSRSSFFGRVHFDDTTRLLPRTLPCQAFSPPINTANSRIFSSIHRRIMAVHSLNADFALPRWAHA